MRLTKEAGKQTVKMSKTEWLSIGKTAGWVEAQNLDVVKTLGKLTDRELTRAIRDGIMAEEGAIKQYETVVDSTKNKKVKKVLQSIADEEKAHVGELQALLKELLPDEQKFLNDGAKEAKK